MLIFIGYDSRSKGYKWYNPRNSKIIIKRDVEFDEANSWDWSSPKEVGLFFFFFFVPFLEDEELASEVNTIINGTSSSEGVQGKRSL